MSENGTAEPEIFVAFREELKSSTAPVAAVKMLTDAIRKSKANTLMELEVELMGTADSLKHFARDQYALKASITLSVISDLFLRYVTRTSIDLDMSDFELCKKALVQRGENFAALSISSRHKIAEQGRHFIRNGSVVLIHSFSQVVLGILLLAAKTKHFSVIVTESRSDFSGVEASKTLLEHGIPVQCVADAAVGYIMSKVDMVIVGSEGIVENGGTVNTVGTYQIAIVAKAHNKPFYVAAESYKFSRLFPLNQDDLPDTRMEPLSVCTGVDYPKGLDTRNPSSDYTPPSYITLLFTDLGVLTPSAVSDELIKLYQ